MTTDELKAVVLEHQRLGSTDPGTIYVGSEMCAAILSLIEERDRFREAITFCSGSCHAVLRRDTMPETVKVIINGKEHELDWKLASYEELVELAGVPGTVHTVTYKSSTKQGSLDKGDLLAKEEGLIVNVSST